MVISEGSMKGDLKSGWIWVKAYQKILKSGRIVCHNMSATKQSRLVSIPKSDLDSLKATIETLENEYVMDRLERSEQDIQNGRVRNVREFLKELWLPPDEGSRKIKVSTISNKAMKCPICGKENSSPPIKEWTFNVFQVSRYKCSECGDHFNTYVGEKNTYTIPRSS